MKSWLLLSCLIVSCSCLLSCHSSKKLIEEQSRTSNIAFEKITADSIIKRIEANQDLPFLTAKGHLKFSPADETLEGNITLYVIRDSLYLAVIKKLGIE